MTPISKAEQGKHIDARLKEIDSEIEEIVSRYEPGQAFLTSNYDSQKYWMLRTERELLSPTPQPMHKSQDLTKPMQPTPTPENTSVEEVFFQIFNHKDFPTIDGRYIEYKRLKAHIIGVITDLITTQVAAAEAKQKTDLIRQVKKLKKDYHSYHASVDNAMKPRRDTCDVVIKLLDSNPQ